MHDKSVVKMDGAGMVIPVQRRTVWVWQLRKLVPPVEPAALRDAPDGEQPVDPDVNL